MDPATSAIMTPIIQWGFAGFCAVLLGIIVWMIKNDRADRQKTNELFMKSTEVISQNTSTIAELSEKLSEDRKTLSDIRDRVLHIGCTKEVA